MTNKQLALRAIGRLSENTSWTDILEGLRLVADTLQAQEGTGAQRVQPHDEVSLLRRPKEDIALDRIPARDELSLLHMKLYEAHPQTWTEHVRACMPKARLMPPAGEAEIAAAEAALGVPFPTSLREFLGESNGVDALWSDPVCSLDRIIEMNHSYRTEEGLGDRMPFDHLLFFGDTGNGDDFAFPIHRNGTVGDAVFLWDHETDSRQAYATGLGFFLVRYATQFYSLRADLPI